MLSIEYFSLPFLYPGTVLAVRDDLGGKSINLIGYFLFISLFLIALYYVMQFAGKRVNGFNRNNQNGLKTKVIPIGLDKRILAIELEGRTYLFYMDRQTTLLMDQRTDLPEDFFADVHLSYQIPNKQFNKILESMTQRYRKRDE